jgi:hypothetical protein
MKRAALVIARVVLAIVLGDLLARYIASLPYEMSPLTDSIRFALRAFGQTQLDNPDDIETLALVVILLASIGVAALAVWLATRGLRALRARASHQ